MMSRALSVVLALSPLSPHCIVFWCKLVSSYGLEVGLGVV